MLLALYISAIMTGMCITLPVYAPLLCQQPSHKEHTAPIVLIGGLDLAVNVATAWHSKLSLVGTWQHAAVLEK